ncbi:MAG TPA: phosphatase PAP2 family protein [Chloroflexota bacterium]|nr:phosphatase PAP2 family protein [Chloroflexota bacterium]
MDYQLAKAINGLSGHNGAVDAIMEAIATKGPYILLALIALLWLLPSPNTPRGLERRLVLYAVLTAAVALGINQIIGHLWLRPRPFVAHPDHIRLLVTEAHDSSFPSDHAALGFGLAFPILLGRRDWGLLMLVCGFILGFARVFVGAHYPGDIAGSFVIALILTAIFWAIRARLEILAEPILRLFARLHLASEQDAAFPAALAIRAQP